MMLKSIFFAIILFFATFAKAQELRCNVSVSATKITGSNRMVFQSMQRDLYEFMNNRKWTDHKFKNNEKIECNIHINLDQQISSDQYKGTIQIQSKRPVYGSSYNTTVLNIKDNNFQCSYKEFQPIEFDETSNTDNLTSILAYYAYVIIGMDYDSFSPEGGTEYFTKAQQIVTNSQNINAKGWKSFESDYNRYWLINNILNKAYSPFRECIYAYHRKGLDRMSENPDDGRAEVAESLRSIQKVFRSRPTLYILRVFFDSKSQELIQVFSKSFPDEQNRVYNILSECDPSNANKYNSIKESKEEFEF